MSKALDSVTVVDLTTTFWGSLGAAMLGDFGAEVIRIDDPSEPRAETPEGDWNYVHDLTNRNKMSLAVALETTRGRDVVQTLAKTADIVITDRPLAWLEEHGLDYATLQTAKPDLVYVRGSGFGPKGPDQDLPALDELAAAHTGMMGILPQPEQPPLYPAHGQIYTTIFLAFGAVTALHHRDKTGEGQQVDTSLLAGNMYGASLDLQAYLAIGGDRFLRAVGRLDAGNPMSGTLYPTQDGLWVTLTMPDTDRWWPKLAEIVDLDPSDSRFDSHDKRCEDNRLELLKLLDEQFRKKPAAHWRSIFTERQMSADVIEEFSYPVADEHVRRNGYIIEQNDPSLGPLKTLGFPIFMSDTPARLHRTAPRLGQHSADVLHERLGYSEEQIIDLATDGVIAR